uniref:Golgin candidate 2 n=1 Tax=Brassica oleracea var. oleracea TaxID=109376 RepID=A0A0D3DQ57_BRAOL
MANWISSKLKAAETILQQIDQQAAESLRKDEKPETTYDEAFETFSKSASLVSLKDQLRKKTYEGSSSDGGSQRNSLELKPSGKTLRRSDQAQERATSKSLRQDKPTTTLTDNDWTELLSAPPNQGISTSKPRTPCGTTSVNQRLKKDGKKNPLVSDGKKSSGNGGMPHKQMDKEGSSRPSDADMESKNASQDTHKESEKDVNAAAPSPLDNSTRYTNETFIREKLSNVGRKAGQRKDSSFSSDDSESDYESDSSTDSERERQRDERRRRREKVFAEKVAAKAVEAAELQTNMMETLDAADLEKQKHNNTRMEVFSHLAGLEATNTELTRSFAAGQKKLQTQIDQVTLLREQVEVKESALEVLKRKTSNIRGSGNLLNKLDASRGDIFEHQMLEAEISLLTDKIGRLQDKVRYHSYLLVTYSPGSIWNDLANKLEADISTMKKDLEEPTEVETELRRRLHQLTDHLIQKQSQVEALSSEKATILFRIEARLIEDNKGMSATEASSQVLEAGEWKLSGSKLKPAFQSKIRSGKKHLGWLVMQLNAIFVSGTVFLRRNPTAKIWALVYLVCLHLWVLYILLSHSSTSSIELKSGAVISLENFSNSSLQ